MGRMHKYNIHLKLSKCEFRKTEVVYLGLKIDAETQNIIELRSFLGMIQYYHPFLPDLATTLAPKHVLFEKEV